VLRSLPLLLALAALFAAPAPAAAQTAGAPSAATYEALRAQLLGGDTDIDYGLFRRSYARTAGFAPRDPGPRLRRDRMFDALFRDGDAARAGLMADTALGVNYTDLNGHFVRLAVATEDEDEPLAAFHQAVLDGLLGSILDDADGRSADAPLALLSIHEAHAVMGLLGMRATGRAAAVCAAGPCTRFEVVQTQGDERFPLFVDFSAAQQ
jgi:hypothetical protein